MQGEVLRLDLEFQNDSGARHLFDPIAYGRSGRLGIDRVIVAPASGVDDPLRDYYRAIGFGFIGGGTSTPPAPLDGPTTRSLAAAVGRPVSTPAEKLPAGRQIRNTPQCTSPAYNCSAVPGVTIG